MPILHINYIKCLTHKEKLFADYVAVICNIIPIREVCVLTILIIDITGTHSNLHACLIEIMSLVAISQVVHLCKTALPTVFFAWKCVKTVVKQIDDLC